MVAKSFFVPLETLDFDHIVADVEQIRAVNPQR
ncbi:MAG TPA: beta-hydroxyacyl-ACP dehydratase, partial [Planctomycetaceae bacterium]|nr:beta-hydroxyacyl-ACP dehydratase [Planctomycetaceae bacterium]